MAFQDKTLTCSDCGASFTFSAEDQEFYKSKGYANEPKRCPDCRQREKPRELAAAAAAAATEPRVRCSPQPAPSAAKPPNPLPTPR